MGLTLILWKFGRRGESTLSVVGWDEVEQGAAFHSMKIATYVHSWLYFISCIQT